MNRQSLIRKLGKMAKEQIRKDTTHGVWSTEFYFKVLEKLTQERVNMITREPRG